MSEPKRYDAENAVGAIVEDLNDRRGLKGEWRQIDSVTRDEITAAWAKFVERAIRDAKAAATKSCTHPSDQVVADILQADSVDACVRWCRICGAYSVSRVRRFLRGTADEKFTAWEVPLGKPLAPIGDKA